MFVCKIHSLKCLFCMSYFRVECIRRSHILGRHDESFVRRPCCGCWQWCWWWLNVVQQQQQRQRQRRWHRKRRNKMKLRDILCVCVRVSLWAHSHQWISVILWYSLSFSSHHFYVLSSFSAAVAVIHLHIIYHFLFLATLCWLCCCSFQLSKSRLRPLRFHRVPPHNGIVHISR